MDRELKARLQGKYSNEFIRALDTTMRFEGGWSDHSSDRGGKTKYGITQRTLRNFNSVSGTWGTIERLTQGQAAQVYHRMFWMEMRIDGLRAPIQGLMFDWSVHAGFFAIRSLQRHLKLKPDGNAGPKTRATVDEALGLWGTDKFVRQLAIRRMKHLCRLVRRDRTQGDFIVGWFDRVSHFLK